MAVCLIKIREALSDAGFEKETIAVLVQWSRKYLDMGSGEYPKKLSRKSAEQFLRHLINDGGVTRANQDIALEALRVLHQVTRGEVPEWMDEIIAERSVIGAASVLSYAEVRRLFGHFHSLEDWLMAGLIYGSGLRELECVRLRVIDLDLDKNQVAVRDSYGRVERWAPLASDIRKKLDPYLKTKRQKYIKEMIRIRGQATLQPKMATLRPQIRRKWLSQYLFTKHVTTDYKPELEDQADDHIEPNIFRQNLKRAAIEAYIFREVNATSLRNSFASHIRVRAISDLQIQQILGKKKPPRLDNEAVPIDVKGIYLPLEWQSLEGVFR